MKYILLIPFLEILLFVLFGDFFGFFPVIFFIFITGVIGLYLLKTNVNPQQIKDLVNNPKDWMYQKIAGIFLLIPGFITDFIGLVLFVKSLRKFVWDFIPDKAKNNVFHEETKKNEIIEGEYKDLDDSK